MKRILIKIYWHPAIYIDPILKGKKSSDLPVERAPNYDPVINLNAANALGLGFPPTLLARATK
ncbi:hypothetical protein BH11PSE4_BH11PSE4_17790 [soil metagenome]